MARLILPLFLTAVAVFSIVDISTIDRERVKHVPKTVWIILVIITSIVGSILWFTIGRARRGEVVRPARRAPLGPTTTRRSSTRSSDGGSARSSRSGSGDLERQLAELDDEVPDGERPGGDRPGDEPKPGK